MGPDEGFCGSLHPDKKEEQEEHKIKLQFSLGLKLPRSKIKSAKLCADTNRWCLSLAKWGRPEGDKGTMETLCQKVLCDREKKKKRTPRTAREK